MYRRLPGKPIEVFQWFEANAGQGHPGVHYSRGMGYHVITIHGQSTKIVDGDWILPEPDGLHFYPCKPDIFAATYEPA